jgi:L-2-hydroxyglutarate oxidase LhgO
VTDRVQTLVVGAGAVGLAIARALALAGHEVIVAERENKIGTGVSARNSEVVHAGIYYKTGSLKARLCVRGKTLMSELAHTHGFEINTCGKLIVATDSSQHAALQALAQQALINGVHLQWLDSNQARALEPQITCTLALYSPGTGIVDSQGYMLALQADLEQAGGMVALNSGIGAIKLNDQANCHRVIFSDGTEILVEHLINAAGLGACLLAKRMIGLDPAHQPNAFYAKGSYFALAQRSPFKHLIYPAPQDAWLGVHATLDLGGQCRFGPDLEWLPIEQESQIDYQVQAQRAADFYLAIRKYWPDLKDGTLVPSYSGVRPKVVGPNQAAIDFVIESAREHGVQGLINLFGIESPGLTSSMAIGEYVTDLLLGNNRSSHRT